MISDILRIALLLLCVHLAAHVAERPLTRERFKVVFAPQFCKRTCIKGQCRDTCEQGSNMTLIGENGHATDTLTGSGFRVVVCPLPCMNGGQCTSRNHCLCPPEFTGRFCHIPVSHKGHAQKPAQNGGISADQVSSKHAIYTVQVDAQNPGDTNSGKASGSRITHSSFPVPLGTGQHSSEIQPQHPIVNVRVHHPPDASVEIHRINSHMTDGNNQGNQQMIYLPPGPKLPFYQQRIPQTQKPLGRCFQETLPKQSCSSNPLPGLTKQEDCCGSVGTSWGQNKCHKCPHLQYTGVQKSGPVRIEHGADCPQGYKPLNSTHCQDINECMMPGVCENGECRNVHGSFHCSCKYGYVMGPSRTQCIADKAEEKGLCYRFVNEKQQCEHPLPTNLTKQLCCCSVGKAWGSHCERCPAEKTAAFKEICPAGRGYYYQFPNVRQKITIFTEGDVTVEVRPDGLFLPVPNGLPSESLPEEPSALTPKLPAHRQDEVVAVTQFSSSVTTIGVRFPEILTKPTISPVIKLLPDEDKEDTIVSAVAILNHTETDACKQSRNICGQGECINGINGYSCNCYAGYQFHPGRKICLDENECLKPGVCGEGGRCINYVGHYKCDCNPGFRMKSGRPPVCADIDECLDPNRCSRGRCENRPGSYKCTFCQVGYKGKGKECHDINECAERLVCENGRCENLPGSYRCVCNVGYTAAADEKSCEDINECRDVDLCTNGRCINTAGSFMCHCPPGYHLSSDGKSCKDIDECASPSACVGGNCINTVGFYICACSEGYQLINGQTCQDIDECALDPSLCYPYGTCKNIEGSFTCSCYDGYVLSSDGRKCEELYLPNGKKECYLNFDDTVFCDSVLATNITKEECCCSLGAGWGDHCEIYPCPVINSAEFLMLCPDGKGFIMEEKLFDPGLPMQRDIDECVLFGNEICKEGKCVNTQPGYECYCKQGFYYDSNLLQCVDVDECQDISNCVNGHCINLRGSYQCDCPPPMIYEAAKRQCVPPNKIAADSCWRRIGIDGKCGDPMEAYLMTYAECCCRNGMAWGRSCQKCPAKNSDAFVQMCKYFHVDAHSFGETGSFSLGRYHKREDSSEEESEECVCRSGSCVRTNKGLTCECPLGFQLDQSKTACNDIDECKIPRCKNSQCINTKGSYYCRCKPGFVYRKKSDLCIRQYQR
ncbi:latent-transforming growth factor beta-binding protein 3 [Protopterus annectens]|uniref:latent-transforming growth factor beta-binding protein 3 n=1 Tax=Protopterus annectens TaxID=7888 RepID=UPI001CFBE881|nr:latent-transforming growth factor beta-binding protein 3 [Protopterus annectens]